MSQLSRPPAAFLLLALAAFGCGGSATAPTAPAPEPEPPAPPKAEVRGDTNISGGDADYARPQDFSFAVANVGGSPLELRLAQKSCTCERVDLPAAPIAPGALGNVVIHWTPAVGSAGAFSFGADVATNDPKTKALHFTVSARVRPLVRVMVEGREDDARLDFGDDPILPGQKRTREVKVFSTVLKSFTLNASCPTPGIKIAAPAPLPAGTSFGEYDHVLSGYTLEVSTDNGLPLGFIRTQLSLALSGLGEGQPDRTLSLPVRAVVGQGVCTVSPSVLLFNKQQISEEDTAKVRLTYINSTGKEDVSVESVEPSFVQVDKPAKGLDGKWLITAHIPPNNADAMKYQAEPPMIGKVVLKVAGLDRPVSVEVKWDPLPK